VHRGAEELGDAYGRHRMSAETVAGPHFLRIKRVQELQETRRLDDDLRWRLPIASGWSPQRVTAVPWGRARPNRRDPLCC
jgi:hypothetical protein